MGGLVKNAEKVDLITRIHNNRNDGSTLLMLKLISIMVNELRELNDVAAIDEFPKNQGKIEVLKELSFCIENGVGGFCEIPKPHY